MEGGFFVTYSSYILWALAGISASAVALWKWAQAIKTRSKANTDRINKLEENDEKRDAQYKEDKEEFKKCVNEGFKNLKEDLIEEIQKIDQNQKNAEKENKEDHKKVQAQLFELNGKVSNIEGYIRGKEEHGNEKSQSSI